MRVRYLLQKEREVHRMSCAPEYSYLGGLHLQDSVQLHVAKQGRVCTRAGCWLGLVVTSRDNTGENHDYLKIKNIKIVEK